MFDFKHKLSLSKRHPHEPAVQKQMAQATGKTANLQLACGYGQ
jgi:hypothetical protein